MQWKAFQGRISENFTLSLEFTLPCYCLSDNDSVLISQGYDHSYYFISSFVEVHIKHHARYLKA